jgi:hypothetical protein
LGTQSACTASRRDSNTGVRGACPRRAAAAADRLRRTTLSSALYLTSSWYNTTRNNETSRSRCTRTVCTLLRRLAAAAAAAVCGWGGEPSRASSLWLGVRGVPPPPPPQSMGLPLFPPAPGVESPSLAVPASSPPRWDCVLLTTTARGATMDTRLSPCPTFRRLRPLLPLLERPALCEAPLDTAAVGNKIGALFATPRTSKRAGTRYSKWSNTARVLATNPPAPARTTNPNTPAAPEVGEELRGLPANGMAFGGDDKCEPLWWVEEDAVERKERRR